MVKERVLRLILISGNLIRIASVTVSLGQVRVGGKKTTDATACVLIKMVSLSVNVRHGS